MGNHVRTDTPGHQRDDEAILRSGWNLNNIAVLNRSLLRFVPGDISGMDFNSNETIRC